MTPKPRLHPPIGQWGRQEGRTRPERGSGAPGYRPGEGTEQRNGFEAPRPRTNVSAKQRAGVPKCAGGWRGKRAAAVGTHRDVVGLDSGSSLGSSHTSASPSPSSLNTKWIASGSTADSPPWLILHASRVCEQRRASRRRSAKHAGAPIRMADGRRVARVARRGARCCVPVCLRAGSC